MTPVSVLYAVAFAIYLTLVGLVITRNYRSRLGWACAGVLLCMAVWSFADIYHNHPSLTEARIRLFSNIGALGWCTVPTAFLLFVLVMTDRSATFRVKLLLVGLLALPAPFLWAQLRGLLVSGFIRRPFGWSTVWSASVWPYLYYGYFLLLTGMALYLLLNFRRRTPVRSERRQAKVVFWTALTALAFGAATDVFIPRLTSLEVPELAGIGGLVWAAGLYYAATRHGLLSLTPQTAADDILSTMPDSLLLLSSEGNIVTVNRAGLDALGYGREELTGRPASGLTDDPAAFEQLLAGIRSDGSCQDEEIHLRTRDGRIVPFSLSARVMKDRRGDVIGIVFVLHDITTRRQTGAALHESEERYKAFVRGFQGVAFSALLDFSPVFVHGAVSELTGYTERDFMSGTVRWRDLIHPDDVDRLRPGSQRLRTQPGFSTTREYRIIRKDGAVTWVREAIRNVGDESGKPVKVNGTVTDISEHRRALDELMLMGQFRESVIDSTDLLMTALDGNREVVIWNRAAEHITGYTRGDVMGHREIFGRLFPDPDVQAVLRKQMTESLPRGGVIDSFESELVAKDGSRKTLAWYIRFLTTVDGRFGGHIVLGRDLTGQRQAEAALRESEASFRALAENANDGIAVVSAEGFVLFINRRGAQIAGTSAEQLLGIDFRGFIRPQDAGWLEARFAERLRGETAPPQYPLTVLRRDGMEAHLEVTVAITRWHGERAGLIVFRDVTGRGHWTT